MKVQTLSSESTRHPWAIIALAAFGLAVSVYLTVVHYTSAPIICLATSGCESVNQSVYAELAGIPIALLGAGAYLAMLAVAFAEKPRLLSPNTVTTILFGISLSGTLYSAYLTYVELFVLRAICSWCVLSALAMTAIFVLVLIRLRRSFLPQP